MIATLALDDRYLSDALEVLAGPFIEGVDLMFDGDPAPFVKSSRSRRHLLMAICDCSPDAARSAVQQLADQATDRQVLASVYDPVAPIFPSVLRRLGREPMARGDYAALNGAILRNPRLGRGLTQLGNLTPLRVQVALALPPPLQERSVVETCPGLDEARALGELFRLAVERNGRAEHDLAFAIQRARSWSEVRKIVRRATTPQKLVDPPWEGDADLVWVPTTSRLKETGGRLANCLVTLAEMRAREQEAAFYVWQGDGTEDQKAVCAVVNERPFGWRIAELEGHSNRGVPPAVRAEIVQRLAAHGVEDRPGVVELLRAI